MKQIFTILTFIFFTVNIFAQSPERISYQAVIYNSNNQLVINTQVGIRVSIEKLIVISPNLRPIYQSVYIETHSKKTNENGLLSIQIGGGTVISGDFSSIDWSDGEYFIKTETDPTGGISYSIAGRTQLLSVPYALHAKTAEAINGESSSNNFYLGQDTLGGIVFYIYLGQNGQQHGLIVSKIETTAQWQTSYSTTNAILSWDGAYNMNLMTSSPAKNWITANFSTDWYLPSIDELNLLYNNRFHANRGLNDASATLLSKTEVYWSSTEIDITDAITFDFRFGYIYSSYNYHKNASWRVRAIRSF